MPDPPSRFPDFHGRHVHSTVLSKVLVSIDSSCLAPSHTHIVSESAALHDTLDRLRRVAPTDATVLITGETGTGKELLAHAVHGQSRRATRPLVTVNLAAMPETLVAAELFGHEHGAFTGAVQRRIGRFEVADQGTLFLDEVGELTPDVQVLLLRALQEGEFERLGGSQTRRADVRIVAATNCNLETFIAEGRFRADLFYRLAVFPLHLPPLRERRDDIPTLVEHFLARLQKRIGRHFDSIDAESLARLMAFDWPGNIRQLQNVIEHAAILCDAEVLRVPDELIPARGASPDTSSGLPALLHNSERHMIEHALAASHGRVAGAAGAAACLGVPASTLESKIRRFGIDKLQYRVRMRFTPR
jgi:transcriptional regulator with GAF, ATPase, and Fis domain